MKPTHLRPYPAHQDSGVPWLGDVPAHWGLGHGRSAFREKKVKNIGTIESQVLSLSYGRIVVKPPEKLHGLVPESFETYQVVDPDDIIVRSTDLQNDWNSLRIGLVQDRGIITSAYICLNVTGALIPEYAYLLLHTYDLKKIYYGMGSGLRQNLDISDFKYLPILVPPLPEQHAIARYLDHVDRRVNRLIRAKRRLIALLNEQKQAIIHHAVTRGLDPDAPLRPSGVEWLGEIPEHWEVRRTKYVFREVDERSTTGEETHLSMSQRLGLIPSSEIEERRLLSESYIGAKICQSGDLILNRLKAHLGVFALAKQGGLVSPDYTVLRPMPNVSVRYFEMVLRSPACRGELRKRAKGIVQGFWRLYTDDFYDIVVPFPSIAEQVVIVQCVDHDSASVDEAIAKAYREIALIREYRTRLIADVVTGKLDVRAAAAALPEEPAEAEPEESTAEDNDFDAESPLAEEEA